MLGVAALTDDTTQRAFLALALVLPGLLLQDCWRYAFFAIGRGSQAFLNDLVWAFALVPAVVLVHVTDHQNVFWFILAWGAAATVAAVFGALQTRVVPRISEMRTWMSDHRDLGFRYLAEGASSSAANQLRTVGFSLILGLAAVGYIQAAYTIMGPLMIMMFGTGAVIVPEIARVFRRSPQHTPRVCLAYGAGLAAAALAWGVVLLITLPTGLGDLLLGQVWGPAYSLVPLITLAFMGGSIQAGAGAGLRALGAARRSLRAMIYSSLAVVICGLLGASWRNDWGRAGGGSRGVARRGSVVAATGRSAAEGRQRALRSAGLEAA